MKKLNKIDAAYVLTWAKKIKAINLLGGKCKKCGAINIFSMEFHHLEKKTEDIRILLKGRWSKVEKELEKCIVLCCNCHSELHSNNFTNIQSRERNIRIKKQLLAMKKVFECQECHYRGVNDSSLSFHHREKGNKKFVINACSARKVVHWEDILLEMDKCDVLCQNCHAMKHTDIDKFNKFRDMIYEKIKNMIELPLPLNRKIILDMYSKGMKQIEIAKHFGCSKGTVSSAIKNMRNKGIF